MTLRRSLRFHFGRNIFQCGPRRLLCGQLLNVRMFDEEDEGQVNMKEWGHWAQTHILKLQLDLATVEITLPCSGPGCHISLYLLSIVGQKQLQLILFVLKKSAAGNSNSWSKVLKKCK